MSYDPDDERGKRAVFDLALKVAMAAHAPLFKCEVRHAHEPCWPAMVLTSSRLRPMREVLTTPATSHHCQGAHFERQNANLKRSCCRVRFANKQPTQIVRQERNEPPSGINWHALQFRPSLQNQTETHRKCEIVSILDVDAEFANTLLLTHRAISTSAETIRPKVVLRVAHRVLIPLPFPAPLIPCGPPPDCWLALRHVPRASVPRVSNCPMTA